MYLLFETLSSAVWYYIQVSDAVILEKSQNFVKIGSYEKNYLNSFYGKINFEDIH